MTTPDPAYLSTAATPAGDATFAVDVAGALFGLQFVEGRYARALTDELAREGYEPTSDDVRGAAIRAAIEAYCRGDAHALDAVEVAPDLGTTWQSTVWRGLRTIPFGEIRTYSSLATAIGHPTAVRAVARANATNRVPLIVPCHRVIGTNGTLTGFGGGLHLKARLLDHERRILGVAEMWSAFHKATGA
jgi:methylated-DNA-[protein]-cysteine S-methyltransferase